jgi:propionyl-CoA synthetase
MQRSIDDQRGFWTEKAQDVHWHKPFDNVLDDSDIRFPKWFVGGQTNMSYNCLDRHIEEGRGDMPCFFEISAYTGVEETYSYK